MLFVQFVAFKKFPSDWSGKEFSVQRHLCENKAFCYKSTSYYHLNIGIE